MSGYLLGYDLGSSFIKASLIEAQTGELADSAVSTDTELPIESAQPGWAEQSPDTWWDNIILVTRKLKKRAGSKMDSIAAIGITYQMHGLVMVDRDGRVLHPSIIWCDSRAVDIGRKAFKEIGQTVCLSRLLNSPGNFTASKLAWVKQNLKGVYSKIYKIMLPGDFIAMKMTGDIVTTPSGLSEGILWDYKGQELANIVLDYFGFDEGIIPEIAPVFSEQGRLCSRAADELGLAKGIPLSYRAGDQPNNALSLNVLEPGEIAATAGTSGVVYGISDKRFYDDESRVNIFVHVNHTKEEPRYGVLLCLNGTGILYSWIKTNLFALNDESTEYEELNDIAQKAPVGSCGLCILPYGNGAERTLSNKNICASVHGLDFNQHNTSHFLRAVQEGIVFALHSGLNTMKGMGLEIKKIRAGYANMFLSPVFTETFANVTGCTIQLYNTDGSQGAARGAGIGAGIYKNPKEAFINLKVLMTVTPDETAFEASEKAYRLWNDYRQLYL